MKSVGIEQMVQGITYIAARPIRTYSQSYPRLFQMQATKNISRRLLPYQGNFLEGRQTRKIGRIWSSKEAWLSDPSASRSNNTIRRISRSCCRAAPVYAQLLSLNNDGWNC